MSRTPQLAERLGHVTTQATFIQAALLAAHGAGARAGGFRASDVRFFFLLFTNWVEHDVTRPSQDLDLTQVRRSLTRLCRSGWAEPVVAERSRKAPRGQRYLLTEAGVVSLAESLAGLDRAPFDEALFVACFAASYLKAILARVQGRTVLSTAARRRVAQVLEPARILRNARRNTAAVLADLEERVRSSLALEAAAGEALAEGASEEQVVRRLESLGSYQLHRVRPLAEVLLGLPDDLRRFELAEGMGMRARLLFAPLAERSQAELALLERLEQNLAPRGKGHG